MPDIAPRHGAARLAALAALLLCATAAPALAVPSFAEQTGQPCSACHVGGFGPQLTPLGRTFKLDGYTMRAGAAFSNPVSAMAVAAYLHTAADQPAPPAPGTNTNDNVTLDQASLFLAGGYGDHVGGFSQFTYDGVGRAFAWDNLDLRLVNQTTIDDTDLVLGLGLNNAPGVQDPWNTLPAWGYPYTGSDIVPAPAAGTILDGALAQGVLGASAYAFWNDSLYAEAALYWTPSNGFLRTVGGDQGAGEIDGAAPYLRLAYEMDYDEQNFEVGAFAFLPDIYPGGDHTAGTTDSYTDIGLDGSYQFTGDPDNFYSVNARYTHEEQNLAASRILGSAAHAGNALDDLRLDASYYWHNTFGGTIGVFDTTGSRDALLYPGSASFQPDSSGFTFQIDGTLFGRDMSNFDGLLNLRAGIQYTLYTRFDGGTSNYDGLGGHASDNNAVRVFTWAAL